MTTTQNDAHLMTEEQLDALSGGPHIRNFNGARHDFRSSRVNLPPAGWLSIIPQPSLTPRPWRPVDPPFRSRG